MTRSALRRESDREHGTVILLIVIVLLVIIIAANGGSFIFIDFDGFDDD